MEQCRAHPCVYRKIVEEVGKLILVVHVNDILVSGEKEACDELRHKLNEHFPTENLGELKWSDTRCLFKSLRRTVTCTGELISKCVLRVS